MRPATFEHSRRVAALAVRVARHAKLPKPLVAEIYWGALVHDIGELNVRPDAARQARVARRGRALGDQRAHDRRRPLAERSTRARAARAVRALAPRTLRRARLPDGATAQQVPLAVALVGVCDAWDAITGVTPVLRRPLPPEEAVAEMERHAGRQWSRALVAWMLECVQAPLAEGDLEPPDEAGDATISS